MMAISIKSAVSASYHQVSQEVPGKCRNAPKTYVRYYGRPDLFMFTCNPNWAEIKQLLIEGQSPSDRHDLIARVFRQKQIKFLEMITKRKIFGDVRCWMYTIEYQKRGLPHSHNLFWLKEKIQPSQIDVIISAELPDQQL